MRWVVILSIALFCAGSAAAQVVLPTAPNISASPPPIMAVPRPTMPAAPPDFTPPPPPPLPDVSGTPDCQVGCLSMHCGNGQTCHCSRTPNGDIRMYCKSL